jgi:hypothetical protein
MKSNEFTFSLSEYVQRTIFKAILQHDANENENFTILRHDKNDTTRFAIMCENVEGVANYVVCNVTIHELPNATTITISGNPQSANENYSFTLDTRNPNYAEIGNVYYDIVERLEYL